MPKLLNFKFPVGRYFFNCDNTELKISYKIFFPVSKRHRWAVVGELFKWATPKKKEKNNKKNCHSGDAKITFMESRFYSAFCKSFYF